MLPINDDKESPMQVADILESLRRLLGGSTSTNDADHLQNAISSLEKLADGEDTKMNIPKSKIEAPTDSGVVDTSVLTGPIGGLKSFLMKKSMDNQGQ